jgi:hypothetical protein
MPKVYLTNYQKSDLQSTKSLPYKVPKVCLTNRQKSASKNAKSLPYKLPKVCLTKYQKSALQITKSLPHKVPKVCFTNRQQKSAAQSSQALMQFASSLKLSVLESMFAKEIGTLEFWKCYYIKLLSYCQ